MTYTCKFLHQLRRGDKVYKHIEDFKLEVLGNVLKTNYTDSNFLYYNLNEKTNCVFYLDRNVPIIVGPR